MDADWIAAHLDDPNVRVVDVDVSGAIYEEGHISGAVLWDAYKDLRHPDYRPIDRDELDALLSRSGITPETTVVFYGYAPYLGYWLTGSPRARADPSARWPSRAMGECGQLLEYQRTRSQAPPHTSVGGSGPSLPFLVEERKAAIGDDGTVILDVRSAEEFSGERFGPSGATEDVGRVRPGPRSRARTSRRRSHGGRHRQGLRGAQAGLPGGRSGPSAQGDHLLHDREPSEPGRVLP